MRKIIPLVVAGATALTVGGGALAYAGLDHDVTLSVDGSPSKVSTMDQTVGDLLKSRGITVGAHDEVAPAADAKLEDGSLVAVQYGRQVTFNVDGTPTTVWTTGTDVGQAIAALGLDTHGAVLSTSRSAPVGRQGLNVSIATAKRIVITTAGKKQAIVTNAQTVGQALIAAKITVDANDTLSVPATTRLTNGVAVTYTRVDVRTATKKSKVAYDTVRKSSSTLTKGTTKVDTAGKSGVRTTTYRIVERDGKVATKTKTGSKVTTQAVSEVLLVGTKVVKSSSSSSGSSSSSKSSGGSSSGGNSVWDRIAKCESGGNWSINTGNGYYGGLQFSLATWRSVGGKGLPSDASKAEQIRLAEKLQKRSGWGQWSCASAR